jgi:hypothetical protein
MYGVPLDEDWSFFVGREVEQICIGPSDVQLGFGDGVRISIQGDDPFERCFSHKTALISSSLVKGMPGTAVSLVSLVGAIVQKVVTENDTTLAFFFSNMDELRIFDSSGSYESFTISGPNGLIIV